jgi:hypothetical protein
VTPHANANRELVELGDIEELCRYVDRLAAVDDWADLDDLRARCRAALDRGKQLWPVAARAEYRLALDGPPEWAARVLVAGAGRFTPGPLPEVAASTHSWASLAPHVDASAPEPGIAAHERVVRGERIDADARKGVGGVLELPLELQPWEPLYPVAIYEPDRAEFPIDAPRGMVAVPRPSHGVGADDVVADPEAVRALLDLAGAWTAESNGHSESLAVRGTAAHAVAALGPSRFRMVELSPADAMARMAWTAASGGAHGRRRGMAAGRFGAWWAAGALTAMLDEWPTDPAELGDAIGELRWYAWDPGGPDTGWTCRLAAEDPADGLAWALTATDFAAP